MTGPINCGREAVPPIKPTEQWRELFAGAEDAACAVDAAQHIRLSNNAFARLCQRTPEQIHGRSCREVICGHTLDGQRFCSGACPVSGHLARREPVKNFDIAMPRAGGASVWVNIGVLSVPPSWNPVTHIFLLRPIDLYAIVNRLRGAMGHRGAAAADEPPRLTRREHEILRLLAQGLGTRAIAQQLHISILTVRNHIRNICSHLGVHTRAEAVGFAFRHRLF